MRHRPGVVLCLLAALGAVLTGLVLPGGGAKAQTGPNCRALVLAQGKNAPTAVVAHPRATETIWLDPAAPHFIAFGTSTYAPGEKVVVSIKHKDATAWTPANHVVLRPRKKDPRGTWAVQFIFDPKKPPPAGDYTLKVRLKTTGDLDTKAFKIDYLARKGAKAKDAKKDSTKGQIKRLVGDVITIQYPNPSDGQNINVCPTFFLYGTTTDPNTPNIITITVTDTVTGQTWSGTGLSSGSMWFGSITVPVGVVGKLDVSDNDTNETSAAGTITVVNCP
jgi:hypothetical protein